MDSSSFGNAEAENITRYSKYERNGKEHKIGYGNWSEHLRDTPLVEA